MLLLIDNYDSFTYNLAQALYALRCETIVVRNDFVTIEDINSRQPSHIIISPGPGRPEQAGITLNLIQKVNAAIPIFGICLGMQALAMSYGASVVHAPEPVHGKTSPIHHDGTQIFSGLPNPFPAMRYHSLVVDRSTIPSELLVTATTQDGIVMGLAHKSLPRFGVQFHPESILTSDGIRLLKNFLTVETVS